MSTTDLETYEGQLARLDFGYIAERGRWVDAHLSIAGDTVGLDYQPDNGTSYHLLFVPARGIEQLGLVCVPMGLGLHRPRKNGSERWAVVAKVNGTESDWVYPFDLTPGNVAHVGYVAEHTQSNLADATAITALFRAICSVPL